MNFGGANQFISITPLESNGVITKKYLKQIESAVKQRTPIAGSNIQINVTDGGFTISSIGGGNGLSKGLKEITLTVCSNGTPAEIKVYGPA